MPFGCSAQACQATMQLAHHLDDGPDFHWNQLQPLGRYGGSVATLLRLVRRPGALSCGRCDRLTGALFSADHLYHFAMTTRLLELTIRASTALIVFDSYKRSMSMASKVRCRWFFGS